MFQKLLSLFASPFLGKLVDALKQVFTSLFLISDGEKRQSLADSTALLAQKDRELKDATDAQNSKAATDSLSKSDLDKLLK